MRQFATMVGGTRCYFWLKQWLSNSLQGHMKHFCSSLGVEQTSMQWLKGYWILTKQVPTNFAKKVRGGWLHVALQQCCTNR